MEVRMRWMALPTASWKGMAEKTGSPLLLVHALPAGLLPHLVVLVLADLLAPFLDD